MQSLIICLIYIAVFFLFFYFISAKNSYIVSILLSEIFLFILQFVVALIFERVFKDAVIVFFSQESFAPMWLSFVLTIIFIVLFCFFIFIILAFLLLCAMPLPKITYSSKIAPIMSVVASSFLLFCSFDVASVIFTALLMLILTPFVFADHDYSVKLGKINRNVPDIEASQEEKKLSIIKSKIAIEELNESYKRNPFVRFNRELY